MRAGAGLLASILGALGVAEPVHSIAQGRRRRGNPSSGYFARLQHVPMRDAAEFATMSADDRRQARNARKQERRLARVSR